jgi:hypothetical protein
MRSIDRSIDQHVLTSSYLTIVIMNLLHCSLTFRLNLDYRENLVYNTTRSLVRARLDVFVWTALV